MQAPRRSLRENFTWTLAGNVLYAFCQWGMLIALARLGSAESVGRFGFALAITAPVILFLNFELRNVLGTDADREYSFSDYLRLRVSAVSLGVLLLLIYAMAHVGRNREAAAVIAVMAIAKGVEALCDICYGLFTREERLEYMARSMILRGVLGVIAVSLGMLLGRNVFWSVVGLAAAWGLVMWRGDWPQVRELDAANILGIDSAARARMRSLLSLTWPLGIFTLLLSLQANIPRYFLERHFGERPLGVFVSLAYIQVAGTTVMRALGSSASARLGKAYSDQQPDVFAALSRRLLAIGLGLGLAGICLSLVLGRHFLYVVYGAMYAERSDVLVIMMCVAAVGYMAMFVSTALIAMRRLRSQVPILGASVVATILACWLWLPAQELRGAAYALGAGNLVWLVGSGGLFLKGLAKDFRQEHDD